MNNSVECKNIGVDWIGSIPSNWKVSRFKHLFDEKKSTKNPELNSGSISFGQVIYKNDESIPESTKEGYQEVLEGEFLINPLNLNYDLKSLRIALSRINVVVSQGYIVLKLRDHLHPNYYEYLLRKFDVEHMKSLGQGVRQTISFTHLKDENLVVPPIEEQKLISRYLDKKTSQIDSLVEKTQKKIELLKEQRTSLINHYITKGLDPNAEMKDSGVDWIGEIPKHWKLGRFKYYISVLTDYTANGSFKALAANVEYLQEGYSRLVRLTDLREDLTNDGIYVSLESHEFLKKSELFGKEILIANVGAYTGLAVKMKEGMGTCTLGPNMFLVRNDESISDVDYVLYLLNSTSTKTEFDLVISSTAQPKINKDNLKNLVVPIPPKNEQIEISKSLMEKTRVFEETLIKNGKKVSLLKEYRQSLISSFVTGKIRVTEDMI